jgi:hypothetical protein
MTKIDPQVCAVKSQRCPPTEQSQSVLQNAPLPPPPEHVIVDACSTCPKPPAAVSSDGSPELLVTQPKLRQKNVNAIAIIVFMSMILLV